MKRRHILWLCILAVVLIAIVFRPQNNPFFVSAESDLDLLQTQVHFIHRELGIETWAYSFRIPKDRKLIATFTAHLNDEAVPGMSPVFCLVPEDSSRASDGSLFIYFFHPDYERPQGATWQLHFLGPGFSHGHTMSSPFDPSALKGGRGAGTSGSGGHLQQGIDKEVCEYHAYGSESGEQVYDFRYTLTVRLEQLEPGDDSGCKMMR